MKPLGLAVAMGSSFTLVIAHLAAQVVPKTMEEMHRLHQDPKAYIATLEDPARDAYQKPHDVIMALALKDGERIADIGAGSGYFALRFARHVGTDGRVYAVDISRDMLSYLDTHAREAGLANVTSILAPPDDPQLRDRSVDRIFICETWHHIEGHAAYLKHLAAALTPAGEIVIIDFQKKDTPVGPPPEMRVAREEVIREFEQNGFTLATEHTFLPYQYFLVFKPARAVQAGLQASDFLKLRSISAVQLSPDGTRAAYVVQNNDGPGRPYGQLWVMTFADGKTVRFGSEQEASGNPEWSPDGQSIAYRGRLGDKTGLVVAKPDGTGARFLVEIVGTNAPLPGEGKTAAWSPDGKRIAFVSATPGPEASAAEGDPVVITRYLYKPDADEGMTRFNDNRRLHLFVVDVATAKIDQLTDGVFYEHSIDWSPDGRELLFLTDRDADHDEFFNYDIHAMNMADRSVRRLSATESNEYHPRWSPDGRTIAFQATKRGLTDRETTMEDTHVWVMNADGSNRREIGAIDNRQGAPEWTPDGALLFTVQERGMVRLYRARLDGRRPEPIVSDRGAVGAFSAAKDTLAYTLASASDLAQLYVRSGTAAARKVTDLNASVLGSRTLGEVEPFRFTSNDNKFEIEAFLTKPAGWRPDGRYPLIVNIHGGPHGQQGPAFNFKNQVYAAHGWATLMVNYRGSTGYGQAFADAVFGDQNGNEGQDVLYGVSAALRRYPWIDRNRLGVEGTSYGGQLSAWLITQTNIFKAAIPTAAITNIISYNYMTYYNQYEAMEWGVYPHQGNLMDTLLARSALRHVANAHTPTMLMHGENDNDVPIAEAEQFYVALKDVGTQAVMVRYPREGHGLREPKHVVDQIDRSIGWYEKHFPVPTR